LLTSAPTPPTQLSHASASYDTLRGRITSSWKRSGANGLTLTTVIPPNVKATVHVPASGGAAVLDGSSGAQLQVKMLLVLVLVLMLVALVLVLVLMLLLLMRLLLLIVLLLLVLTLLLQGRRTESALIVEVGSGTHVFTSGTV